MSHGSLVPGPRYAKQPERLVWVALLPGQFNQMLRDLAGEQVN